MLTKSWVFCAELDQSLIGIISRKTVPHVDHINEMPTFLYQEFPSQQPFNQRSNTSFISKIDGSRRNWQKIRAQKVTSCHMQPGTDLICYTSKSCSAVAWRNGKSLFKGTLTFLHNIGNSYCCYSYFQLPYRLADFVET